MSKKIVLTSTEGVSFEIEEAIALQSKTIAQLVKDNCTTSNVIPLPQVKSNMLELVIEYCKKHVDSSGDSSLSNEDLKKWDTEFMKIDDESTIIDLAMAAHYLKIESLVYITCQTIADKIVGRSLEDVRAFFGVEDDYTPEEKAKYLSENSWAFD